MLEVVIILLIIAAIFCVVMAIKTGPKEGYLDERWAKEKQKLDEMLSSDINFNPTKVVCNDNDELLTYYLGADDEQEKVLCFSGLTGFFFNYSNIVSAEILVDGKVTQTKKSPSLGGAIVGGVVAGGIGAVVGGTNMGTATSAESVSTIKVHILLRDSSVNSFDIICYDEFGALKTTELLYKKTYGNAQAAFDVLRLIIDKKSKIQNAELNTNKSNIEELKELAELKQQGLITEEEFATMKAKIINK